MNSINKKIIVLSAVFSLLLAGSVFAVVGYSRNPSGTSITTPVSFTLTEIFTTHPDTVAWKIKAGSGWPETFFSDECMLVNSGTTEFDLPFYPPPETTNRNEYNQIGVQRYSDSACVSQLTEVIVEICDPQTPCFEIIGVEEEPEEPTIILDVSSNLPSEMLAFAGALFTDLGSLITLAVGVPMGFVVIKKVISLIRA